MNIPPLILSMDEIIRDMTTIVANERLFAKWSNLEFSGYAVMLQGVHARLELMRQYLVPYVGDLGFVTMVKHLMGMGGLRDFDRVGNPPGSHESMGAHMRRCYFSLLESLRGHFQEAIQKIDNGVWMKVMEDSGPCFSNEKDRILAQLKEPEVSFGVLF